MNQLIPVGTVQYKILKKKTGTSGTEYRTFEKCGTYRVSNRLYSVDTETFCSINIDKDIHGYILEKKEKKKKKWF